MNQNISKMLLGKSRKFLSPYLPLMDAWRQKFVPQLINGMIRAGGLVVTEIARELQEPTEAMEAVWQRLRRHLRSAEWEKYEDEVREAFARSHVEGIGPWTPVAVDLSDLSKPYARKMEFLATVRDADASSLRRGTVLNPGYWVFESYVAVGKGGDPLPVVCFPYSVEDPRFGSENRALHHGFGMLSRVLEGKGILIVDRGFDGSAVFELLREHQLRFLCRQVGNRMLLEADRSELGVAEAVADRMILNREMDFRIWRKHRWRRVRLSFGWREVRLRGSPAGYTFLVVRWPGEEGGRMMLLTSEPIHSAVDAARLIRLYFLRWRAEDAIRMLKRELAIETVRVFDFDSIRRLIEFSFWILAMITLITITLSDEQRRRISRLAGAWATPVLLFHYRVLLVLRQSLARHGPDFLDPGRLKAAEV